MYIVRRITYHGVTVHMYLFYREIRNQLNATYIPLTFVMIVKYYTPLVININQPIIKHVNGMKE